MSATIWVMDFNKSLVVFYLTISPTVIEIAPKLNFYFSSNSPNEKHLICAVQGLSGFNSYFWHTL